MGESFDSHRKKPSTLADPIAARAAPVNNRNEPLLVTDGHKGISLGDDRLLRTMIANSIQSQLFGNVKNV
jgi:hypothetical protein